MKIELRKDEGMLETLADVYVCTLCNKSIKRVKQVFNSIEDEELKSLVVKKFNKRMQEMAATIYAAAPKLEIRIGG